VSALLLDTHVAIWLVKGIVLSPAILQQLEAAAFAGGIYVSPITAWEIGLLATLPKSARYNRFDPDPSTWFAELMGQPGIKGAPFTSEIAVASSFLPEPFHRDPADRLLVATARDMNIPIVTHDRQILAYGTAGYVKTLAC
jgi:PIN domain nuclease of toxin-antitoxin system